MDFRQMMETLRDERCGLYFLAGVDAGTAESEAGIVTIHATEGALGDGHRHFIEGTFAALHPDYQVSFRFHSKSDLHSPDSLESFAQCFRHDHIVSDPTGAFARVSKLVELARRIRAELGASVGRILWQADASALIVLAAPFNTVRPASSQKESFDRLRDRVFSLVQDQAPADLRKAIRSVHVSTKIPPVPYTPIDEGHLAAPSRKTGVRGLFARVSGIAALIGLGTMSAASANAPAMVEDDRFQMPGITSLIGLTTLGENSYGLRNRYQAFGGLRLYFGETGALTEPISMPNPEGGEDSAWLDIPQIEMDPVSGTQHGEPTWPEPSRVAYGT